MDFKKLLEKRNELVEKMNGMFINAEKENRAFSDEEKTAYDEVMSEIRKIDETIKMYEAAKKASGAPEASNAKITENNAFEVESRAFANFIRTGKTNYTENRDAVNMSTGDNGAIIPSTIANKIIETVENICPIFSLTTKYNVKGTLNFPVYDEGTDSVKCAYHAEFTALESHTGSFTFVSLSGYLVGALTKISRSLVTNGEFDVVGYIIGKVSLAIARFLEKEALLGTGSSACQGVVTGATQKVTTKANSAITADELIDLQLLIPQQYQANACWILNTNTLGILRKLKDNDGRYLLQDDITKGFGFTLLGKPVYLSDNMAKIGASAKPIVYGDMSGLFSNLRPGIEMQMLHEKYADEHAVGVVTWFEVDTKVIESQKVAVLAMPA